MSLILTLIGVLLLLASVLAVAFGLYMATHPGTRETGKLFALWWVPGVAAAAGVFMRDPVTFVVGLACFAVGGAMFLLWGGDGKPASRRKKRANGKRSSGRDASERTTRENKTGRYRGRAAS